MMTSYFKGANQCLFWHIHLHGMFGIYIYIYIIYYTSGSGFISGKLPLTSDSGRSHGLYITYLIYYI